MNEKKTDEAAFEIIAAAIRLFRHSPHWLDMDDCLRIGADAVRIQAIREELRQIRKDMKQREQV